MAFFITYFYIMPSLYSFIIPVYNRPAEIRELMLSIVALHGDLPFEVVIVDDGSEFKSDTIEAEFPLLTIKYFYKANTGPGDSRNYGMKRANGDYYIILDSDCLLNTDYLIMVNQSLNELYVDCFGGPDAAHQSFNFRQKAISYVMTSFFTTGGIRGSKKSLKRFEPRSFNMGLSKSAFEKTGGFSDLHPGEDPELVHRLWDLGFNSKFINGAIVYHKRRLTWRTYASQIYKFGLARSILNKRHPKYSSFVFWLPVILIIMALSALVLAFFEFPYLLIVGVIYFFFMMVSAVIHLRTIKAVLFVPIIFIAQNLMYSIGFIYGWWHLRVLGKSAQIKFSSMFFK